ncbi:Tengl4 [Drosophila busckii]|uniref:Tengl4 n=1 Tax=Drosophila busckii TaxID=30019 RepID=A0A0M4EHT0_DROBS|nr:Tengl4 [Drosophila busckii]
MLNYTLPLSLGILAGLLGFVVGMLLQQDSSYRSINKAISNDPYIYERRQQIYEATMFFSYSCSIDPPQRTPCAVSTLMKYGFPGLDDIHIYRNFVLSYDRRNRIAHWVCEHLARDKLDCDDPVVHKPSEFLVDTSIPLLFRASARDFYKSDWVGSQLASPLNYKCNAYDYFETYMLTNIVPVSRGLKTNVWSRLEQHVRQLAQQHGSVYVYTGPLFMPQRITFRNWAIKHQVIGVNTVAVPTHFFKVIIVENEENCDQLPYMEGYVVPNAELDKEIELSVFLSEIRDIEHFAGLKFFEGDRREYQNLIENVESRATLDT